DVASKQRIFAMLLLEGRLQRRIRHDIVGDGTVILVLYVARVDLDDLLVLLDDRPDFDRQIGYLPLCARLDVDWIDWLDRASGLNANGDVAACDRGGRQRDLLGFLVLAGRDQRNGGHDGE